MEKESNAVVLIAIMSILLIGMLVLITVSNHKETKASQVVQIKCIEAKGNWVRIPYNQHASGGSYGCQFNKE